MPTLPPQLDARTLRQILAQIFVEANKAFAAAPDVPCWSPPAFDTADLQEQLFANPFDDAGVMLALCFARLMEITLERLNQAPEKNLRAFLDTMGVSLLLPAPARVPLTFTPADGSVPALVPAGTQAGTRPVGALPPVLFETEQPLTAIPATILSAFTIDTAWDRFTDQTALLTGTAETSGFTPFVGQARMPHILYMGDTDLLNFNRAIDVEIVHKAPDAETAPTESMRQLMQALLWQQRGASGLTPLTPGVAPTAAQTPIAAQSTVTAAQKATAAQPAETSLISFRLPEPVAAETLAGVGLEAGVESRWLYGVLPSPLPDTPLAQNTILSGLVMKVTAANILPDFAFTNDVPLDVTRPFFPFGEQPRQGDVFLLGSEEAFGTPGGQITLTLNNEVSSEVVPVLVWDALMPSGWVPFGRSIKQPPSAPVSGPLPLPLGIVPPLLALDSAPPPLPEGITPLPLPQIIGPAPLSPGSDSSSLPLVNSTPGPLGAVVTFDLPATPLARGKVNGQTSCWIRARIDSGSYGSVAAYEPAPAAEGSANADGSAKFNYKPGTLNPPQAKTALLSLTAERAPRIVTQNGFLLADQTQAGAFTPFLPVQDLVPTAYADPTPAFYLAFDAAFPQVAVTLYVAVAPRSVGGSVTRGWTPGGPALPPASPLEWEYFNGVKWFHLTVFDRTGGLTQAGTLDFLTPPDMSAMARFDLTPRYWIRARSARNDPADTPRISGIFLNTVPAAQAVQVDRESVGSGNGLPLQTLALSRTPVLPAPRIWVREPEMPPQQERVRIEQEEGTDAIAIRQNPQNGPEIWVRWHETPNFVLSEAHSRHYTLDHITGILTFGDGSRGLIPPRGGVNIEADYQTGGGEQGNVGVGGVGQITVALPGINAVTNLLPGEGGAALETDAQARERGPQTLRHRDRAIGAEDMEWLAKQAAGTLVARARCLPNINRSLRFEPGWVTLLIVPQGTQSRLLPGPQLLLEIEEYLTARAPASLAGLTPSRLNITGAGYARVAVVAAVAPRDIHATQSTREAVLAALKRFFHPIRGGRDGQGWNFGRNVYASDVSQLLQSVPGVNHVDTLELRPGVAQNRLTLSAPLSVSQDMPAGSSVEIEGSNNALNGFCPCSRVGRGRYGSRFGRDSGCPGCAPPQGRHSGGTDCGRR